MKTLFHKGGNRGWKSRQTPGKLDQQHGVYNKTQDSTMSVIQLPHTTPAKECCECKREILSNQWRCWLPCREKGLPSRGRGPGKTPLTCEALRLWVTLVVSNPCLAHQVSQLCMTSTPDTWTKLPKWICEHVCIFGSPQLADPYGGGLLHWSL